MSFLILTTPTERGEKLSGVMSFTLACPSTTSLHTAELSPDSHATMIMEFSGTTFFSTTPELLAETSTENSDCCFNLISIQKTLRLHKARSRIETPYDRFSEDLEQCMDPSTFAIYGISQSDPNLLRAQAKRVASVEKVRVVCGVGNLERSLNSLNSA